MACVSLCSTFFLAPCKSANALIRNGIKENFRNIFLFVLHSFMFKWSVTLSFVKGYISLEVRIINFWLLENFSVNKSHTGNLSDCWSVVTMKQRKNWTVFLLQSSEFLARCQMLQMIYEHLCWMSEWMEIFYGDFREFLSSGSRLWLLLGSLREP